jgi:beta-galactosidase
MRNFTQASCFLIIALLLAGNVFSQQRSRTKYTINSNWKFTKRKSNLQTINQLQNSEWKLIQLPHTWNDKDVLDDEDGYYRGTAWYKKELHIPDKQPEKQVFIYFEAANQVAKLYVNNQFVGEHSGGYSAFAFNITPHLNKNNEPNQLLVEVNNEHNLDIPPHNADFTFFGGIYRDVYLIITNDIHFDVTNFASDGVFISTPTVTNNKAVVNVKGSFINQSKQKQKLTIVTIIRDAKNNEVITFNKKVKVKPNKKQSFLLESPEIKNPQLWSPENLYLYSASTQIRDRDNNLLDEIICPLGFRYFRFDADSGFFLNGEACKLIGTSRHQDFDLMGNALPDEYHYRDMKMIKETGMNFVRISHYPQDRAVMEACDRLGLINVVEIPLIGGVVKSDAFFEACKNMQREMIRQNYNHPSTVMWAYMNEVQFTPPGGFKDYSLYTEKELEYFKNINELAQILEDLTRKEDPHRYTNIPMAGNFERFPVGVESGICDIPMVVGWNLYNGWYFEGFDQFDVYVDSLHRKDLKHKPFFVTEYGAGADPRIRSEKPQRFDFSVEWQNLFHEHHLQAILDRPYVTASAVWNFADFNSESRKDAVPHINNKGLVTIDRKPKDSYFYYKAVLSDEPMIKIAPVNYSLRAGIEENPGDKFCKKDVWVYSNADKITLYHNGKKMESRNVDQAKEIFRIPFVTGLNTLEAVAKTKKGIHKDFQEVDFILYPKDLKNAKVPRSININVGAPFYFTDNAGNLWLPDKPYETGNWGYVEGIPVSRENWVGKLIGVDDNILATEDDPLFQTQRINLNSYKLDVPDGVYKLKLCFADILTPKNRKLLPEDVKNNIVKKRECQFNLTINKNSFVKSIDVGEEAGLLIPLIYETEVAVSNGEGLNLSFTSTDGITILNAIRVIKMF